MEYLTPSTESGWHVLVFLPPILLIAIMSYRDMRNFTEMMRALGFPRLISMENFRTPNFPLVVEILQWLARRYDPNADVPRDTDSEQDRIIFIKTIAQFMATRAHVRLNTKKLYQADGYAVKELLKITTMLYDAMTRDLQGDEEISQMDAIANMDMNKVNEVKEARTLASTITSRGAVLYDLLHREVDLRESRNVAIARQLEINQVEKGISASSKQVESEIRRIHNMLENIASDEANLEAKIEKKRGELERNEKRLSTLQSVRPAYMDDFERYEEEYRELHEAYMVRFRNQAFLEAMYSEYCRSELEKNEESEMTLKKMAEQMDEAEQEKSVHVDPNDDDLGSLVDEDDEADSSGDNSDLGEMNPRQRAPKRPQAPPSGARRAPHAMSEPQANFGSMMDDDNDDDDDSDEDESDLDDSDLDLDDDSDDVQVGGTMNQSMRPMRPSGAGRRTRPQPHENEDTDDEF